MLYTVCFTQIMCSVDSLDPGHCPWTSIVEFLKMWQALFFSCGLHIHIHLHIHITYAYTHTERKRERILKEYPQDPKKLSKNLFSLWRFVQKTMKFYEFLAFFPIRKLTGNKTVYFTMIDWMLLVNLMLKR